ncbi:MAG: 30S ribosomal protein S24e [Thermoprotei archaeon]
MSQTVKLSDKLSGVVESFRDNPTMGRKELVLKVFHVGIGTPSRKELIDGIANAFGAQRDLVLIRRVDTVYGAGISKVIAEIYKDKAIMQKYAPAHLIGRDTGQKVKKGGGKGAKQG